jgi:hypothetical protein
MRDILKLLLKCYCSDQVKEDECCGYAAGMKYVVGENKVTMAL